MFHHYLLSHMLLFILFSLILIKFFIKIIKCFANQNQLACSCINFIFYISYRFEYEYDRGLTNFYQLTDSHTLGLLKQLLISINIRCI